MSNEGKCPFATTHAAGTTAGARSNRVWWPDRLNLNLLHQHAPASRPLDAEFDYAEEFGKLDLAALTRDLHAPATSVSRRSTAGPTTSTWTRPSSCP